ncbi:hypothetical protein [Flavobacterium pectinovorum]|uniref:Phage abortive infection protein n=1 Tax=Flavobacterium pectinovorum TaxID=29533 RepID=A0AB36P1K8_9FLAO|nr:hypothetical protein [Flavobacterium pectinovorum]OXB04663.1 hypothetical protein B0A72_11840 [Flavobacterium pectinovorum]SHL26042.1 hypothetical protein SAMN05444387_0162 [Flavobacterium pectinovorum]
MIAGILCIAVTPYLFTQLGVGIDFTSQNANNIGGTIGGITAPFTGLLGSLLVYYALLEQVKANKLIQKQLDEQKVSDEESKVVGYLKKQLEIINSDINAIHFNFSPTKTNEGQTFQGSTLNGSDAIRKYLYILKSANRNCDSVLFAEYYQIDSIKHLLKLIDNFVKTTIVETISEKDMRYLTNEIKYHYISKIKIQFDLFEEYKSTKLAQCRACNKYHQGIPNEFFDLTHSINKGLNL